MRRAFLSSSSLILLLAGCSSSGNDAAGESGSTLSQMPPGPKRPTGTVAERVALAKKQADASELDKAIATLEEGMAIDPKDRTTLGLLALYLKERAREAESRPGTDYYRNLVSAAEYYRRLRAAYPDLTEEEKRLGLEVFYEEARAHAKSLRIEETSGSLRDLAGAGFKDFDRIRKDEGWAGILAIPKFKAEFESVAGASK